MEVVESALLGEFVGHIKSNWSANTRVDQRRRQLVSKIRAMVGAVRDEYVAAWLQMLRSEAQRGQEVLDASGQAAAVASSARRFVAGIKALFVCTAEVDRLTNAVEELELLAGPGGDLDLLLKVLNLEQTSCALCELALIPA